MEFQFTVSAEVERVQGKFESRDTLETAMVEWLEGANEGNIEGDNEGEYEVTNWSVQAGTGSGFSATPKPKLTPEERYLRDIPEIRALLATWRNTAGRSPEETMAAFEVPMRNLLSLVGI